MFNARPVTVLVMTTLLLWGCSFNTSGPSVPDLAPGVDGGQVDGGWILDGPAGPDGGQETDAPADGPGPTPDGPTSDGPTPDGPAPDGPTPDGPVVCPASCAIACLVGTSTCPAPSNVDTSKLPAACGPLTMASGSTYRLCSDADQPDCRLVLGTSCSAQALCSGKAMTQTSTIGGASVSACVFSLPTLTVESGAILQVRGPSPAILVVKGSATIAGKIIASAIGRFGGAGGGDGGKTASNGKGSPGDGPVPVAGGQTCDCQSGEDDYDDCGGGGGGFATAGGAGGLEGGKFCSQGPEPLGGVTYGNQQLVPLVGGSGGGSGDVGGAAGATPGSGGGGGGAIQISASTIELSGAVAANGGPGTGGYSWSSDYPGGGGGAGSGGGILLEAATITSPGGGWALAAGGGGGGGGDNCTADDGEMSILVAGNEQPPTGGAGCNSGGKGGTGAYGSGPSAAQDGQNAGIWQGPGGGGGGAGYLRFNKVGVVTPCPPTGIQTSGVASCGAMQVQ